MIATCSIRNAKDGRYVTKDIQYYTGGEGQLPGKFHGGLAETLGIGGSIIKRNDRRLDDLMSAKRP